MSYLYEQIPGLLISQTSLAQCIEDRYYADLSTLDLQEWMAYFRFLKGTHPNKFHMGYTFAILYPTVYDYADQSTPPLDNGYPPSGTVACILGHYCLFKGLAYHPAVKPTTPSFDFTIPGSEPDPNYADVVGYFAQQMKISNDFASYIYRGNFNSTGFYLIKLSEALRFLHLVASLAEVCQQPKTVWKN